MRVLRLTPHFYWPQLAARGWPIEFDAIGGMQTQIFRQAQGVSRLGVEQLVLTLRIPGAPRSWWIDDRLEIRGVRVPVLPLRSRVRGMVDLNLSWCLGVLGELLRRADRFDVVHVHCSGVFWPLRLGRWVAARLGCRLVYTVHCSILATYEAMTPLDRLLGPYARRCERLAVAAADHVMVLTPRLQEVLAQHCARGREGVTVVPDGIDQAQFRALADPEVEAALRRRFGLPTDKRIVVFVGRIAHEKGWRALLELAERLPRDDLHFLVGGDGNERDTMEALVHRRGLGSRFTITGFLPQAQIPSLLALASLLVLPSIHEELGGILLEALTMECPVVAFGVGGVPHVLGQGDIGVLVPPGDVDGMARAVEWVLANPEVAVQMARRGRQQVGERFGLEAVCRQQVEIYQRVLAA
jgi:glycosyltransferase involved in cell wall biosynthesis